MNGAADPGLDADIGRLMARYAHGIDTGDVAAVLAVMTADCDIAYEDGAISLHGHDEIGAHLGRMLVGASTHLLSNLLVDPRRDGATVRAAAIVCVAREVDRMLIRGVQYQADCVQIESVWKIARLQHRSIWQIAGTNEITARITSGWPFV